MWCVGREVRRRPSTNTRVFSFLVPLFFLPPSSFLFPPSSRSWMTSTPTPGCSSRAARCVMLSVLLSVLLDVMLYVILYVMLHVMLYVMLHLLLSVCCYLCCCLCVAICVAVVCCCVLCRRKGQLQRTTLTHSPTPHLLISPSPRLLRAIGVAVGCDAAYRYRQALLDARGGECGGAKGRL